MSGELSGEDYQEFFAGFVEESRELLEEAEPKLIELEKLAKATGSADPEVVNSIFRLFHTVKGSAGFLGLDTVARVTHEAETLLDHFRSGRALITSEHIDLLNLSSDFLRQLLDEIEVKLSDEGHEDQAREIVEGLQRTIAAVTGSSDGAQEEGGEGAGGELDSLPPDADLPADELDESSFPAAGTALLDRVRSELDRAKEKPGETAGAFTIAGYHLYAFRRAARELGYDDLCRLSRMALNVVMGTVEAKASPSGDLLTYLTEAVGFLQEGMAELAEGREPMIPAVHGISHLLEDGASALGVSLPDGEATLITEEMWAAATGGAGDSAEEEAAASTAEPAGEEERDATADGAGPAPAKAGGEAAPAGPAVPKAAAPPSGSPPRSGARGGARSEGALRVGVDKLDELMNAIEEVVILEAMITQSPQLERLDTSFFDFKKMLKQLEKATHSLQDAAMSIRMVPLAGTFKKMIRLVRDVSRKTNKEAELVIRGEHTEIDKNVIESINDPLVHMIRNSIDHGLESVEERKQAGKPPVGSIRLEAEQVSGQVLIRVVDDGRGLDREKLLARAREKGVIEGDGSSLSDEQVWQLIFAPGFSTAAQVSDVSGRGVGMDVVRSNIEAIGGRVEISSRPGEGSTFTLRIPLTLAVMEGMIVGIGKSRYTIPINMVKETLRLQGAHVENTPEGYEVLKLRDDLIPVARLGRQLGKPRTAESDLYGVVVEDGTARLCLAVDDLVGKHQIVVKGLSEYLGDTRYVSGCTILGDGAVSPILDVPGTLDEFRRQIALAKKQQYRGAEEQLPAT